MVQQQRIIEYPPLDTLFDSHSVKSFSGRRAAYNVDPAWRPTVPGTQFTHQYWIAACWMQFNNFVISSDTGLGKTKSGLDALEYSFQHRQVKHALILTGRPISTGEWRDQARRFIRIPIQEIAGTTDERRDQLSRFPIAPIMVSDYNTLAVTFAKRVKKVKNPNDKRTHWVPDLDLCAQFGRQFDCIILDELHQLKNPETLRYQIVQSLVPEIPIRYGLTGTLFDRHPEDAWAQFFLVDGGVALGNRHDFLEYFFYERPSFWSKYTVEYKLQPKMKDEFKRRLRAASIRVAFSECKDIPAMQHFPINLRAPKEMRELIKECETNIRQAHERDEQFASFAYLRQLVSGLVRVKGSDDEGDFNTTIRLKESPKLDWTLKLLDDLEDKEQIVIFYEFRASGEWLNEALTAAKHKVSWLYGGMTEDENEVLELWKKKKTRVLLTQTTKAAESLNLQQSAYLVQYEAPTTYRLEKQSLARVGNRIGGRPSIAYKLAIRGCIEQRIMALIREGLTISTDLLDTIEEEEA